MGCARHPSCFLDAFGRGVGTAPVRAVLPAPHRGGRFLHHRWHHRHRRHRHSRRRVPRALLAQVPEGTWELVTHPGYNDADLAKVRTRLHESRNVERLALQVIKEFPAIELISFADLQAVPSMRHTI